MLTSGDVIRRTHGDVPDPIALAEEMVSGEVGDVVAVHFFKGVDLTEDFLVEIRQAKPEDVFLFFDFFLELQMFLQHAIAAGGVD